MVPKYVVLEKPRGITPLEAIDAWKAKNPEYLTTPASYAGRLDPMASGKLLVLLGNECRKSTNYTKLDKEYEVEVVLDLGTDTGDALGLPTYQGVASAPERKTLSQILATLKGSHQVPYPAFSSKTVKGKPLFQYALEGTLSDIQIPSHIETIHRISLENIEEVSRAELQMRIDTALVEVPRSVDPGKELGADFRQDVIRAGWRTLLGAVPDRSFTIVTLRVTCGSGAYMRTLSERLAALLHTTGFALSIHRTQIGVFRTIGPFGFWSRKY